MGLEIPLLRAAARTAENVPYHARLSTRENEPVHAQESAHLGDVVILNGLYMQDLTERKGVAPWSMATAVACKHFGVDSAEMSIPSDTIAGMFGASCCGMQGLRPLLIGTAPAQDDCFKFDATNLKNSVPLI